MERVNRLTERLKEAENDQKAVDEIYEEVVGLMKHARLRLQALPQRMQ